MAVRKKTHRQECFSAALVSWQMPCMPPSGDVCYGDHADGVVPMTCVVAMAASDSSSERRAGAARAAAASSATLQSPRSRHTPPVPSPEASARCVHQRMRGVVAGEKGGRANTGQASRHARASARPPTRPSHASHIAHDDAQTQCVRAADANVGTPPRVLASVSPAACLGGSPLRLVVSRDT